jgi:predicted ferric reductase
MDQLIDRRPESSRGHRELGFGAALLIAGVTIGIAAGPAAGALASTSPEKLFWTGSRITAFLAYLAFGGSVAYGLAMTSGILDAIVGRPVSFSLHQDLALVGLAFTAAHVFLLLGDSYIGYDVVSLLVPSISPYKPVPVALGQIAAWVGVAVILTTYLRKWIGVKLWRRLHTLSTVVFVLATAHGVLSGSDTRLDAIWWIYVVSTLAILFLAVYRLSAGDSRKLREMRPGI